MSPEERFSHALHTTARLWRAALDRRMKDLGISQSGWLAIAYIAKAGTPLSQNELATLLSVEAATVVTTVDKLEKAGLVIREVWETDRRVKHLQLTEAGQGVYATLRGKADEMRKELLSGIDPETLSMTTGILERLQSLLEAS